MVFSVSFLGLCSETLFVATGKPSPRCTRGHLGCVLVPHSQHFDHWVREVKDSSQVVFEHVAGVLNLADIMTKCLKGPEFRMKRELVMD